MQLLACKFIDRDERGRVSDAVACIQYCTRNGARIIQASWSGGGPSQAMEDVIKAAGRYNVLFVTSAGNRGNNLEKEPSYPASYKLSNMLVVASSG